MRKCCRSLPRCASCPVLLAAHPRTPASATATAEGDPFDLLRGRAPRELPPCVLTALASLDERRFVRRGGD